MAESQYKVLMGPNDPDGLEAVNLLTSHGLRHVFNIYPDTEPIVVEEKSRHNWPNLPLVYFGTEFLGGLAELRKHIEQHSESSQNDQNDDLSPDEPTDTNQDKQTEDQQKTTKDPKNPAEDEQASSPDEPEDGLEDITEETEDEFDLKLIAGKKLKEKLSPETLNKGLIELENLPEQDEIMIFQSKKLIGYFSSSSDAEPRG